MHYNKKYLALINPKADTPNDIACRLENSRLVKLLLDELFEKFGGITPQNSAEWTAYQSAKLNEISNACYARFYGDRK